MMKIVLMRFYVFILLIFATSCNYHTAISYRLDKSEEYCKQDGYMFNCEMDGSNLVVSTFTPESWGAEFYYDYLEGKKSNRKVRILNTKLKFINTNDTLILKEVREEHTFIYKSKDIHKIIDENEKLKLTINMMIDSIKVKKYFLLYRHKNTYSTGTFPHS